MGVADEGVSEEEAVVEEDVAVEGGGLLTR